MGAKRRLLIGVLSCTFAAADARPCEAQQRDSAAGPVALSLADALRRAEESSERVAIARAGVLRGEGEQRRARSEYLPQLFGSAGYTRTLESEFSVLRGEPDTTDAAPSEPCGAFTPDPALPLEQRVDSLESAVRCASTENPFAAFSDLPFGRENQLNLGLSASQVVFSGGRIRAQNRIAGAGRDVAEIELNSVRAQTVVEVTQAYYDAVLADRLLAIAEATLEQAEGTLAQVVLARDVGEQPEFEALRAQVTRDAQRPIVIQRRADRELARMRLKQLVQLPLDAPLELTDDLEEADLVPVVTLASEVLALPLDTAVSARAPVRQAAEALVVNEGMLSIARAQRLPSLSLSTQYGRVAYPSSGLPGWGDFRTNWTVSASVQLPLFTGGRIRGDEMVAQANLAEARARLELTRELAVLDTRDAVERLEAARAAWQASAGTVDQAVRAYGIAEIRYQEGISTQLELNDSRLLLQQAQANRAVAARDLQVARIRVALLPFLPLGGAAGAAAASSTGGVQASPRPAEPPAVPAQPGIRAAQQSGAGN